MKTSLNNCLCNWWDTEAITVRTREMNTSVLGKNVSLLGRNVAFSKYACLPA